MNTPSLRLEESNANLTANFYIDRDIPAEFVAMAYGVFIHRSDSIYDDSPAERYQFPSQYLDRAKACEGDWILYYEPVKVEGSRGYFAAARVERIVPDSTIYGMFVAIIEPGSYVDFVAPVPFRRNGDLVETGLLNEEGKISGRAQAAVRTISPSDFNRILALGVDDPEPVLPRTDNPYGGFGLYEEQAPFIFEHRHDRVSYLASRAVRDRMFRRVVLKAYGERCAITGLKLINGGGRAEVDAAHIRPVESHGPDIVTNGIALSGTAHWMFDRGLISLSDDLDILVSRHVNDIDAVWSFVNKTRRARLPIRPIDRPHASFLEWHPLELLQELGQSMGIVPSSVASLPRQEPCHRSQRLLAHVVLDSF